jgi:uncharacterized protein (TIGR03437 family)
MKFILALLAAGGLWANTGLPGTPLAFEPNRGQTDPRAAFIARAPGYMLFLNAHEATLRAREGTVRVRFEGGKDTAFVGEGRLPGISNYYHGREAIAGVPHYASVRAREVWPGIGVRLYGDPSRLEYDFEVLAGRDPAAIRLRIDKRLRLNEGGDLVLKLPRGELVQRKPVIYQLDHGRRVPVSGGYSISRGNLVAFRIGAYDHSRSLIIDPVLSYSTITGGSGLDVANGVAVDADSTPYITGSTDSADFPAPKAAGAHPAKKDVFVTHFSRDGHTVVYTTFFGGEGDDIGRNLAPGTLGSIYVIGSTTSTQFPTTSGVIQSALSGSSDAFITKLDSTGAIQISTYLGGSASDDGWGIALDSSGNIYVSGNTSSTDFPSSGPNVFQSTYGGGDSDIFVAGLAPDASKLVYSTYVGGSGRDVTASRLSLFSDGTAVVGGETSSSDFKTPTGAAQATFGGGPTDGFVILINNLGSGLWSSFLGGTGSDAVHSVRFDNFGNVVAGGSTDSADFPLSGNGFQQALKGRRDGFVTVLSADGGHVVYSTYLGGSDDDDVWGLAIDPSNRIGITGATRSTDFPVTPDALQTASGGDSDAFFSVIDPGAATLTYSTFLGGPGFDQGLSAAVDRGSAFYFAGTVGLGFPVTIGAPQLQFGGGNGDAFVARIARTDATVATPQISVAGVVNAASFAGGAVTPGEIVTIFGTEIGPPSLTTLQLDAKGFVRANLGTTHILFDGVAAPLVYVTRNQVSAVVPYEVAGKSRTVMQVIHQGVPSNQITLAVTAASPGFFTLTSNGLGQAAALNQDNTLNQPSTPAARGSVITLFGTGEGQTNPAGVTGSVTGGLVLLTQKVTVTIGGQTAEVLYAGEAPSLIAGVLQINARIPATVSAGNAVPVSVIIGSASSPAGPTISVK